MSLSLRDENEWEILCSSSTTWLMINLFTSIVIYDVRRIGFTDNEERKENAHAPIFGWMCSGLERTAKKSLYLFILVINVRITVISAFGTSSQMRIDTIFAVDIYIYSVNAAPRIGEPKRRTMQMRKTKNHSTRSSRMRLCFTFPFANNCT